LDEAAAQEMKTWMDENLDRILNVHNDSRTGHVIRVDPLHLWDDSYIKDIIVLLTRELDRRDEAEEREPGDPPFDPPLEARDDR
jgi:hypothetical protein